MIGPAGSSDAGEMFPVAGAVAAENDDDSPV